MSLAQARALDDQPLPPLQGRPPYSCRALAPWRGRAFTMPSEDPRLEPLFYGGEPPSDALHNLVGAATLWSSDPDWMDLLDPGSPAHDSKLLERDLYLHHWRRHLQGRQRVLDLGGGAGRFTQWLLARGCEVELADPDLRSLWRTLGHVAGGPGRLDLHWTTGEHLPALRPVDLVLAVEVLCYAEDPAAIVQRVRRLLQPGGLFLLSVEARYGWAMALDAPAGCLEALFTDGLVFLPGDRWVRTFQEQDLRQLLSGFEILLLEPTHYATSGPFEAAADVQDLQDLLRWEERCRDHPLTAPWNRAWTAVARKPQS